GVGPQSNRRGGCQRPGALCRSRGRSLGAVSRRRPVLHPGLRGRGIGCLVRAGPQDRHPLLAELRGPEVGWLQPGRLRGRGPAAQADRPGTASLAAGTAVLSPETGVNGLVCPFVCAVFGFGLCKSRTKGTRRWPTDIEPPQRTFGTTGGCSSTGGPTCSNRRGPIRRPAATTTSGPRLGRTASRRA